MRKRYTILIATAFICLPFSPGMFGSTIEEWVLSDGADIVTVAVGDTDVVTVTCNSGSCGQITQADVGSKVTVDSAHGTVSITHASFGAGNNYTVSVTAVGGGDNVLPTLMDFNQADVQSNSGSGTLTSTFTDTGYTDLSSVLNVSDSNVTDVEIEGSTIDFSVFTNAGDTIPAGTQIYANSLTGHSDSNGADGVDVANPNFPAGSLTSQVVMAFASGDEIQDNISIADVAVPEPASIFLFGIGLGVLVRYKRR